MPNPGLTPKEAALLKFKQDTKADLLKEMERDAANDRERERIKQDMRNREYERKDGS